MEKVSGGISFPANKSIFIKVLEIYLFICFINKINYFIIELSYKG